MLERIDVYIPIDRRHALARGDELPDRSTGAALFADLSGFTPLTEALASAYGVHRGAEELTYHLNRIYEALIDEAHRFGGTVISFSGDAITCWFDATPPAGAGPGEAAASQRAATCALAMQAAITRTGSVAIPGASTIAVGAKIAVTSGAVRRFQPGRPRIQRIDTLAGAVLDRLAALEHLAARGEVLVGVESVAHLPGAQIGEWREDGAGTRAAVLRGLSTPANPCPWPPEPALDPEIARAYALPPVYQRLAGGHGQFLAELRPVTPLFLAFSGIDYDADDAGARLDAFVSWVQDVVDRYGGALLQLTIGDKGSYVYAAFGAPIAHEDDAMRAVAAAVELSAPPPALGFVRELRMGITRGQVCAGDYGSSSRRVYGVLGTEVNVAARLMQRATPGQILVARQVAESAANAYALQPLAPMPLKGVARPVEVFAVGERRRRVFVAGRGGVVGRKVERAALSGALEALRAGQSGTILIEAEGGMGKSRLVQFLLTEAAAAEVLTLGGAGDAIERAVPYFAWRPIVGALLSLDHADVESDPAVLRDHAEARVRELAPDLAHLAPLLGAVLGVEWPESELTRPMAGEVRAQNTQDLLVGLLAAVARTRPLLLTVEDAHLLDSASWALLRPVRRGVDPLLLLIAYRPFPDAPPVELAALRADPATRHMDLATLSLADMGALVAQHLDVGELPGVVAEFIFGKTDGHPFFSIELAYALRDAGLLLIADGRCQLAPNTRDLRAIDFPDTIQGVITSRIDRLTPEQQLTVKVASVIGRLFAFRVLRDVHPVASDEGRLLGDLEALHRLDLTPVQGLDPELSYVFKHMITHEVSYGLMTFAQRRQLHRMVAEWYERTFGDDSAPNAMLLAHHWRRAVGGSEDVAAATKALHYAEQAGQYALRNNANQEAVGFFGEALELEARFPQLGGRLRRGRLLRLRGEARNRLGQTQLSRADLEQALAVLGAPRPRGKSAVGISLLRQIGVQVRRRTQRAPVPAATGEEAALLAEITCAYSTLIVIYYINSETVPFAEATLSAINLAERLAPSPILAEGYATLCVLTGVLGRAAWAEGYARRALAVARGLGEASVEAAALLRVGVYRVGVADWARGDAEVSRAIELDAHAQNHRGWGDAVNVLVRSLCFQGRHEESLRLCAAMAATGRKYENVQHEAWAYGVMAYNMVQLERWEEALAHAQQSIATHGASITESEYHSNAVSMARARLALGRPAEARALADPALAWMATVTPSIFATQPAFVGLPMLYLDLWEQGPGGAVAPDIARSAAVAIKALAGFARVFPIARPGLWLARGRFARLSGKPAEAERHLQKAMLITAQLGMPLPGEPALVEVDA